MLRGGLEEQLMVSDGQVNAVAPGRQGPPYRLCQGCEGRAGDLGAGVGTHTRAVEPELRALRRLPDLDQFSLGILPYHAAQGLRQRHRQVPVLSGHTGGHGKLQGFPVQLRPQGTCKDGETVSVCNQVQGRGFVLLRNISDLRPGERQKLIQVEDRNAVQEEARPCLRAVEAKGGALLQVQTAENGVLRVIGGNPTPENGNRLHRQIPTVPTFQNRGARGQRPLLAVRALKHF